MFISIITVVYNGEKTIRRTIESVLCQEFKDYEYIIVDGLSKDSTVSIAKEYEKPFDGRLHIYSERDKGIYDAMNKGIKLAKGDYVWLVNADDWIEPEALKNIYDYYIKYLREEKAIIAGWMNLISSDTNNVIKVGKTSREYYERACQRLTMGVCHPATIVPKSVYDEVGLFDDRYYISADIDFILRCYKMGISIAFPELVLTNMMNSGISGVFPVKKNIHDIGLRVKKFCPNVLSRYYYFVLFVVKFFVVKIRGRYY